MNLEKELVLVDNDVLWNSRRFDRDIGLYYYKYRHYAAELGRWLGRDPIEEDGGINLYAFVGNDVVNRFDRLGLIEIPTPIPPIANNPLPDYPSDDFDDMSGNSDDFDGFGDDTWDDYRPLKDYEYEYWVCSARLIGNCSCCEGKKICGHFDTTGTAEGFNKQRTRLLWDPQIKVAGNALL